MYQFLKDFAGPAATVIASVTAAYFVSLQTRIADKQAETAVDQLRYNLFEKRFAIYNDVKDLLRLLINDSHKPDFDAFAVVPHYVVMSEAHFFFSEQTCSWLHAVEEDCQSFLHALAEKDRNPDKYATAQSRLLMHLRNMPQQFTSELSFRRLTGGVPSSACWPPWRPLQLDDE